MFTFFDLFTAFLINLFYVLFYTSTISTFLYRLGLMYKHMLLPVQTFFGKVQFKLLC